ncbi:adenylate/guanylate cyclase domain-containing protein [Pseudanabaena sp. 'Roaring Creek']|uniref:adenylate/guanylate cyclase domain-containing protein n=1 Tax=Pseudanabaena sp. 'Roaring Creek' TaxID=1681830 RepID=UPI0006D76E5C|nr:adenylate/guanylate cyclase domain-containing protein [Pseudanabaena sp. 'Roaring Creek']
MVTLAVTIGVQMIAIAAISKNWLDNRINIKLATRNLSTLDIPSLDHPLEIITNRWLVLAIAIAIASILGRSLVITLNRLKQSNKELESLIQEKTNELDASKSSLQRTNFILSRREQQLRKQQNVLFDLTKDRAINQGDFIVAVQNITRTGCYALNVERVSIWLFDKNKTLLHCLDLYQKSTHIHSEANVLTAAAYPSLFTAILENRSIAIEDVQEDPVLQELVVSYCIPLNVVSVLLSRFELSGEVMGIILFEHTEIEHLWIEEEISFAHSLSDLLALSLEAQERRRAEESLRFEQKKSERLLLNVLPQEIAERLKSIQSMTKVHLKTSGTIVADSFEEVTVLFADIVNFTEYAASISASELVNVLNDIFSEFDHLVEQYELEKIKTIGDSYMVVGGLPVPSKDHAELIAEMALQMQTVIQKFKRSDGSVFSLRIGIHTGQAIAGVIGTKKFIYDLWGDTVNVASRMESYGLAGCIQVTEATYQLLKPKYVLEERGAINIKGKGEMITYLLKGKIVI